MENLKEIVWGAVGMWATVEILKELRIVWDNYRENYYRNSVNELRNIIAELETKLPKKGKR